MLDYEWVNPTPIILSGDELTQDSGQTHHIFDHYNQVFNQTTIVNPSGFAQTHQQYFHHPHITHTHLHHLNDQCVYSNMSYPVHAPAMLPLEQTGGASFGLGVPKSEPGGGEVVDFTARIGLNLGGRTYFSSEEDEFVNRVCRRFRPVESNSPKCQVDGCNADLTHAKNYHRRHKVCEFHSKATTVIAAGGTQRFCQQCSRFHVLSEFDNGKRSCRRRLADHNRRRRKSQQPNQEHKSSQLKNTPNSSSQHLARSPPQSGTQSSSPPPMTIAFSPPPMSLDFFRQGSNQDALTPSSASNSSFSQLKWPITLSWDEKSKFLDVKSGGV